MTRGEVWMELRRRIGAYGLCRDVDGRVLLVRTSPRSDRIPAGTWMLPGGRIEHGEHPAATVVREVAEETGLAARVVGVREVLAEVVDRSHYLTHTDSVVFDLTVTGGQLRPETAGTSDRAAWLTPAEVADRRLSWATARVLGLPLPPVPEATGGPPVPEAGPRGPGGMDGPAPRPARGQRFAAYGLVTDPDGRLLLTLISQGYPSAGRWHLPGGGTDFGEQPADGLLREITEESAQHGRITGLLTVANNHNPAALGPEGYPIDWHSVRAVFQVAVDRPTTPRVLDSGGSTVEAGWFTREQVLALPLTDVAAALVGRNGGERAMAGDSAVS